MIPVQLPKEPKGNSPEAVWMRKLLAYVRAITPHQTPTIVTDITTRGAFPKLKPGSAGTGSSSGGGARWA